MSACWAVVVAGGAGVRLGLDRPKAFMPLAGQPMLAWSVGAFAHHPAITDVLAVVPRGWAAEAEREVLGPLRAALSRGTARVHRPVIGGAHRQDSVRTGLEAAARLCRGSDLGRVAVLIHDAARPIVAPSLIDELLACLRSTDPPRTTAGDSPQGFGRRAAAGGAPAGPGAVPGGRSASWQTASGAVPVVPVGDTLKVVAETGGPTGGITGRVGPAGGSAETGAPVSRVAETGAPAGPIGRITGTIDRDSLWRVQTPQAFPLGPVLQAHRQACAAGHRVTDDAMLFEWLGWPVVATAGSALGIKITYPEDLALLEGWLRGPGARGGPLGPKVRRPKR